MPPKPPFLHTLCRSPMGLMESLKERIPANNPQLVGRRIALEEVIKVLTGEGCF